jgi:uncharacterized membrane protein
MKLSNSVNSRFWVAVATAFSFAFAIYNLGNRSLWYDEAVSVYLAQKDWSIFWSIMLNHEAYQSLYLFLLKLWIPLGNDEATLRFLSVLFSTASIPIIYLVGKELFDSRTGVTAGFLLGVNGFFIYYAQEARGYTLLLFLVLCSSYFAIICVKNPSRRSWAWYIVFSVLAVYAHFFGIWVLLVHAVSLFFLPRRMIDWKGITFAGSIIALCLLPILFFIIYKDVDQAAWIPKPTLYSIAQLFYSFLSWPMNVDIHFVWLFYGYVYIFLCFIPIIMLIRSCTINGASMNTWRYAFIVCWLFLPIILVYSLSMVRPMFINRYLIIAFPGFILLAAVTLTRLNWKWASFVASAIFVIISVSLTINSYSFTKNKHWRVIVGLVESTSLTEDAWLFNANWIRIPFEYYQKKANNPSKVIHYANPGKAYSGLEGPEPASLDEEWIKKLSGRHQRLWFILGDIKNPEISSISVWLKKYFIKQKHWDLGGQLHVVLYLNKENLIRHPSKLSPNLDRN